MFAIFPDIANVTCGAGRSQNYKKKRFFCPVYWEMRLPGQVLAAQCALWSVQWYLQCALQYCAAMACSAHTGLMDASRRRELGAAMGASMSETFGSKGGLHGGNYSTKIVLFLPFCWKR